MIRLVVFLFALELAQSFIVTMDVPTAELEPSSDTVTREKRFQADGTLIIMDRKEGWDTLEEDTTVIGEIKRGPRDQSITTEETSIASESINVMPAAIPFAKLSASDNEQTTKTIVELTTITPKQTDMQENTETDILSTPSTQTEQPSTIESEDSTIGTEIDKTATALPSDGSTETTVEQTFTTLLQTDVKTDMGTDIFSTSPTQTTQPGTTTPERTTIGTGTTDGTATGLSFGAPIAAGKDQTSEGRVDETTSMPTQTNMQTENGTDVPSTSPAQTAEPRTMTTERTTNEAETVDEAMTAHLSGRPIASDGDQTIETTVELKTATPIQTDMETDTKKKIFSTSSTQITKTSELPTEGTAISIETVDKRTTALSFGGLIGVGNDQVTKVPGEITTSGTGDTSDETETIAVDALPSDRPMLESDDQESLVSLTSKSTLQTNMGMNTTAEPTAESTTIAPELTTIKNETESGISAAVTFDMPITTDNNWTTEIPVEPTTTMPVQHDMSTNVTDPQTTESTEIIPGETAIGSETTSETMTTPPFGRPITADNNQTTESLVEAATTTPVQTDMPTNTTTSQTTQSTTIASDKATNITEISEKTTPVISINRTPHTEGHETLLISTEGITSMQMSSERRTETEGDVAEMTAEQSQQPKADTTSGTLTTDKSIGIAESWKLSSNLLALTIFVVWSTAE